MLDTHSDLCEITNIGPETRELLASPKSCPALSLYGIRLIGISFADATFEFVRHAPDMTQLLVCMGGEGEALVDGQWRRCTAGWAYLTPPELLHAYRSHEPRLPPGTTGDQVVGDAKDSTWQVCWVIYSADGPNAGTAAPARPELIAVDGTELRRAIESLYYESMGRAEPAVLQSWAALVHAYAQRAIAPPSRLRKVWSAVGRDLARPWTLPELAEIVFMSPEHLRRVSRQEVGCSPMRYVTELRMREAAVLLASDFYTVEAVADRVGYENAFAFSTAFKRHTGHPPSHYRRSKPAPANASTTE